MIGQVKVLGEKRKLTCDHDGNPVSTELTKGFW